MTGASKGFGRESAEAALERGDTVAGTARDPDDALALVDQYPDTFLGLRLDATDRAADLRPFSARPSTWARRASEPDPDRCGVVGRHRRSVPTTDRSCSRSALALPGSAV